MSGKVYQNGSTSLYNSMKNYINYMDNIINSPGFFINNFRQVQKQINEINKMKDTSKNASIISIKKDLYDYMVKNTNWNELKNSLISYVKSKKHTITQQDFIQFNFKYNDVWDELSDDYINNMFTDISDIKADSIDNLSLKDKKKIKSYNENKAMFKEEMNEFLQNVQNWENELVSCRNNNYSTIEHNVKCLYNIHKQYVYEKVRKMNSSFSKNINGKTIDCVEYNNGKETIILPLKDSQQSFIKDSIKLMLGIH